MKVQGFQVSWLIFSISNPYLLRVIRTTRILLVNLHNRIFSINTPKPVPVWAMLYSLTALVDMSTFQPPEIMDFQLIYNGWGRKEPNKLKYNFIKRCTAAKKLYFIENSCLKLTLSKRIIIIIYNNNNIMKKTFH